MKIHFHLRVKHTVQGTCTLYMYTRRYTVQRSHTRTCHRWRNPVRIVGALMSMHAQSGRGSLKLVECTPTLCAVSIIANSMVGHPLESLLVPLTQNIMSTCILTLRTGGCVWAFRRIVLLATKIAPPNKIVWGRLPPLPPRFRRLCMYYGKSFSQFAHALLHKA